MVSRTLPEDNLKKLNERNLDELKSIIKSEPKNIVEPKSKDIKALSKTKKEVITKKTITKTESKEKINVVIKPPVVKLDTQVVIKKRVIKEPVQIASSSNKLPELRRRVYTDTLIVIKREKIYDPNAKISKKEKAEAVHHDTLAPNLEKNIIKSVPQKIKKPVVSYEDDNFAVTIQDMKVQSVRVRDFDDALEFRKFENLRKRKMVPTYDAIVDALLKSHPKFGETPEKLEEFLADFSYAKYKELVYDKFEPSNKYDLIWNRFKEQFVFYRTDFRLTPQWDPRIYFPSHYNNVINWGLELIMVPLILINIIPLLIAMYKRDWLIISLAVLVFLHILLHALVGYIPRYRITIYPAWITFAVYGYDQITRYLIHVYKNRKEYKLRLENLITRNPKLS